MINGTSACTGWLIGDEGHLMTNEHCVANSTAANNVTVEFMAQGANCATDCTTWFGCPGTVVATSTTLVKANANLDYALLKLPTNVTSTYGFLQLRETGAVLNERIYIPQHPLAWGKRVALESTNSHDTGGVARVHSLNEPRCLGTGNDIGYYADTQGGSSGSPVIGYSDNLVIALHHCANCPNRGVPIQEIIDDLGNDIPNNAIEPPKIVIGSPLICNDETYTLQNVSPSTVATWSVSPNLKILSFTNTSVTVEQKNTYPNGEGYIEAQFSSDIVRKDVWVGGPKLYTYNDDGSKNYLGGGYSFPVSSSTRTITVQSETYNTTYTWDMFPTDIQWVGINNKAVFYVNTPGNYVLTVEATDPCGSQLMFFTIQIGGNNNLSIYPNPVTQGSMSVTVNSSSASNTFSGGSTTNQVKIYDLYGIERFSNSYNSNSFTINGLNFEPGNYILNVTTSDGSVIQEIIIIE